MVDAVYLTYTLKAVIGEPLVVAAFHSMTTLPAWTLVVTVGGALGATAHKRDSSFEKSL
jgi:hypothetical protein